MLVQHCEARRIQAWYLNSCHFGLACVKLHDISKLANINIKRQNCTLVMTELTSKFWYHVENALLWVNTLWETLYIAHNAWDTDGYAEMNIWKYSVFLYISHGHCVTWEWFSVDYMVRWVHSECSQFPVFLHSYLVTVIELPHHMADQSSLYTVLMTLSKDSTTLHTHTHTHTHSLSPFGACTIWPIEDTIKPLRTILTTAIWMDKLSLHLATCVHYDQPPDEKTTVVLSI